MIDESHAELPSTDKPNLPVILGMFASSSDTHYENIMVSSVALAAREAGCHLVVFVTGGVGSKDHFEVKGNMLFDLVDPQRLDGLIINGTLGHTATQAEMAALCQRYTPLPIVGIAADIPGVTVVQADNYNPMRALVQHLVSEHSYRKLLFIGGPPGQPEAEARLKAFLDVIQEQPAGSISYKVTAGNYSQDSGRKAMREALLLGEMDYQAVVCANDTMAIGALQALENAKIRFPDEIAVTGFDDTQIAQTMRPGLTTVRQILSEQGRIAVQTLLRKIGGENYGEKILVPARLVVRQSCGCGYLAIQPASPLIDSQEDIRARCREVVSQQLHRLFLIPGEHENPALMFTPLLDALDRVTFEHDPGGFLPALTQTVEQTRTIYEQIVWQEAVSVLRAGYIPAAHAGSAQSMLGDLMHLARIEITRIYEQRMALERERQDRDMFIYRSLSDRLLTAKNLAELLEIVAETLPEFGFTAGAIHLFETPNEINGLARMILHFDQHGRTTLKPGGIRFQAQELMPQGFRLTSDEAFSVVVALYSEEEYLGFAVLQTNLTSLRLCSLLQVLLSSTLQQVMLVHQRKERDHQLETAYEALQKNNRELETLAYSVSHDLKAPLRGIDAYSRLLAGASSQESLAYIQKIHLATSQMNEMLDDLLEYLHIDQRQEIIEDLSLPALMQAVLEEFQPVIAHNQIAVRLQLDVEHVRGMKHGLQVSLRCLVENAIKFLANIAQPQIEISALRSGGDIILSVTDNGIGFDMQYHDRIFQVFQRLNRIEDYPGTGIGLALVRKNIEKMGGIVWAESAPGRGAAFYIRLPAP